jgi:serine O-acetyltransferase
MAAMILDLFRRTVSLVAGSRSRESLPEPAGSAAPVPRDERSAHELPLRELLAEDFATYDRKVTEPGLWAVTAHRLGSRIGQIDGELARRPLQLSHRLLSTAIDWMWGINLSTEMQLGRRVRIWHNGSIFLDGRSIGNDVILRHDTTFGPLRSTDAPGPASRPVIEDGAEIGSGACVLGGVTVGKGAMVGANSVVLESVAPGVRVIGVPARAIPDWISRKKTLDAK